MFVDSHAHLDGPKYSGDLDAVLDRARAAGVENILCIGNGTGPRTLDCAARLAEQYEELFASTGVHPHGAALASDAGYIGIERLIREKKVIAVGEIGLDYFYKHSSPEVQQQVFIRQMEIARA